MSALLGDGLPPLIINDSDLQIDRKLPEAKQKPGITPSKDAKENQLKEGAIFRSERQKRIKEHMNNLQGEELERKLYIKKTWNSSNDLTKQSYLNMLSNYNLNEYKSLIDYIKQERAWWKSTYSAGLTVSVLENIYSDYLDEKGDRIKRYEDALAENEIKGEELLEQRKVAKPSSDSKINTDVDVSIDWSKITPESAEEAVKKAEEAIKEPDPFKRSVWDDVSESWAIIAGSLGSLIWLIFGLRFASSIANEYYYKKAPYKILMFVYTFIFTPVLIPYFIFKTIRTWLFPDAYPPFVYRCFLPLYESEDPKLANSWFTYILDEMTIADKFAKIKADEHAKRKILETTVLEDLQNELAKSVLLAAKPPAPKGC